MCFFLGRYEEAREYAADELAGRRKVQGEDHPYVLTLYGNLATARSKLGDPAGALEYARAYMAHAPPGDAGRVRIQALIERCEKNLEEEDGED